MRPIMDMLRSTEIRLTYPGSFQISRYLYKYFISPRIRYYIKAFIFQNEEVKKSKQEAVIVDSPNILHAGISKETLAKLGVKVKAVDKPVVAHQHEQLYSPPKESVEEGDDDDDEDITSPLPSILKKPKPLKLTEESRVEISPGLFTKRPSKSSEKVEKVEEINLDLDQSPKLPSLKTVNLNHLLNEKNGNKKDVEISGDTPEMPDFKTTEVRHWSTQKKSGQRSSLRPSKATNGNEGLNREDDNAPTTPEMPLFQSQAGKLFSAKKALRNNKENTDPDEEEKEDTDDNQQYIKEASSAADVSSLCETPELPECKTINLASLLQKSKGTVL